MFLNVKFLHFSRGDRQERSFPFVIPKRLKSWITFVFIYNSCGIGLFCIVFVRPIALLFCGYCNLRNRLVLSLYFCVVLGIIWHKFVCCIIYGIFMTLIKKVCVLHFCVSSYNIFGCKIKLLCLLSFAATLLNDCTHLDYP